MCSSTGHLLLHICLANEHSPHMLRKTATSWARRWSTNWPPPPSWQSACSPQTRWTPLLTKCLQSLNKMDPPLMLQFHNKQLLTHSKKLLDRLWSLTTSFVEYASRSTQQSSIWSSIPSCTVENVTSVTHLDASMLGKAPTISTNTSSPAKILLSFYALFASAKNFQTQDAGVLPHYKRSQGKKRLEKVNSGVANIFDSSPKGIVFSCYDLI